MSNQFYSNFPNWDDHKKFPYAIPAREEHINSQRKVPAPKPVTIETLFPQLDRWAIGYTGTLDLLQQMSKAKTPSYPPYNITKFADGKFEVQMAVAGFRKDEIEINIQDRVLTVSSEVAENEEAETFGEVLHHGIAQRNFKSTFALAEYVEVDEAKLEDGILTIKLVTNLPDEKKPRIIDIN
jgi:molecular chaperone IbpA